MFILELEMSIVPVKCGFGSKARERPIKWGCSDNDRSRSKIFIKRLLTCLNINRNGSRCLKTTVVSFKIILAGHIDINPTVTAAIFSQPDRLICKNKLKRCTCSEQRPLVLKLISWNCLPAALSLLPWSCQQIDLSSLEITRDQISLQSKIANSRYDRTSLRDDILVSCAINF